MPDGACALIYFWLRKNHFRQENYCYKCDWTFYIQIQISQIVRSPTFESHRQAAPPCAQPLRPPNPKPCGPRCQAMRIHPEWSNVHKKADYIWMLTGRLELEAACIKSGENNYWQQMSVSDAPRRITLLQVSTIIHNTFKPTRGQGHPRRFHPLQAAARINLPSTNIISYPTNKKHSAIAPSINLTGN
jgi:hypothetical protein